MKFRLFTVTWLAVVVSCICINDADAWGTRAQRAIAAMAIQKIQNDFPDTFSPEDANYMQDVLRGCVDGVAVLAGSVPLGSDAETVAAIDSEIQLLRDARKLGPSSYFAYRMGVLSALVSNVILPYGFAWTPEDKTLQAKIVRDIDERFESDFSDTSQTSKRDPIYEPQDYFKRHRMFGEGNRGIIRDDYARGLGYNGLLLKGGPAYFDRAANSVADAWSTVLINARLPQELPTPRPILSWYFVNEIEYLLGTRKNYYQADKAYANFDSLSANQPDGYEKVGDHYYAFSESGGIERGVREWMISYAMDGAVRGRIAGKLHDHFLGKGTVFLERGIEKALAKETDLPDALTAFEEALRYNPQSETLSTYIQDTRIAIKDRKERFDATISLISKGESVRARAQAVLLDLNYGLAINMYRQAVVFFEAIDNEFSNLEQQAKDARAQLNRDINSVVSSVTDAATETMDNGTQAEARNEYDRSINLYELVPQIVSVIPEDINTSITDNKNEVINSAKKKVDEAKINKVRWEAQQEQLQQAGQAPQN